MDKPARKLTYFLLLVVFIFIPLSPFLVKSQQNESVPSEFNPNYIISDEEMQDYNSMAREDIQAFLDDYEGYIANWRTEDKDGVTRTVSDIIYRAAQDYRISPKYILVKLQKEMSLITDKGPTQRQLDFATGYDCPDSGGCGEKNRGFGKQVDAAAGIMRWYYDHVNTEIWIKRPNLTTIIDGQVVIPQNYATAFLYTYTPHLHGNENFWKLWRQWFGHAYPDGTLLKANNSPSVYLLLNGKKRAIKSMSVLQSRFDVKMIISVPASELINYPDGADLTFPNYSLLKNGDNYYLVDYDTLRPFASHEVVRAIGYYPDEFIEVTSADMAGYTLGQTITAETKNTTGRLVRAKENNALYYLKENVCHPITDEQIAKINFPGMKIEKMAINALQNYEVGGMLKFRDGALLGIKGSNKIYVIENNKKRHIASEEVFNGYGFDWKNIIWTDQLTGVNHETAQPLYLPTRLAAAKQETTAPATVTSTGKMFTVPEDKTVYAGKIFTTNVNTYLAADYASGEILAGKNIDTIRPLASFTKVMSAYLMLKEGLILTRATTYNPAKHQTVYNNFRIVAGEKIKNENLMRSLLVSSLNTPARMLAANVEKDENKFIARMNQQAKDLGLKETKYTDTYGYDLGNISTAREFLTIYTKAEKNVEMRRILGMKNYEYDEIIDKDGRPHHYDNHSNELMNKIGLPFTIISSKTAYLDEAGAGVVMLIERPTDKKQFIIITMGNPDYAHRFVEPEKLARWVLNTF